jgi:hypothetical protein
LTPGGLSKKHHFSSPNAPYIQGKTSEKAFLEHIWDGGIIGARKDLKIRRWKHREGSTPSRPTDMAFLADYGEVESI